jgi:plastocyanin
MEQKHIDEIDESFSGEEFIDESDVTIEAATKPKKKAKSAAKKAKKEIQVEKDVKPATSDVEKDVSELMTPVTEQPEVTIIPAKAPEASQPEVKPEVPKDPWGSDEPVAASPSSAKQLSTWKAITGIAVILLLFSVFTDGFSELSGDSTSIGVDAAEQKALEYVNTYLLTPPFTAMVESSTEIDDLYQITLSVAGQSVDSYLTKDGKLFFPQGFIVAEGLPALDDAVEDDSVEAVVGNLEPSESDLPVDNISPDDNISDAIPDSDPEFVGTEENRSNGTALPPEAKLPEDNMEAPQGAAPVEAVSPPVQPTTKSFTVSAKKWWFSPRQITVNKGDSVELNLVPSGFDFTFSIPDLSISEEVRGPTTVAFTVKDVGSFNFECSSCDAWRGMSGVVVVE